MSEARFKRVLHYKMEFGSLRVLSPPFQGSSGIDLQILLLKMSKSGFKIGLKNI